MARPIYTINICWDYDDPSITDDDRFYLYEDEMFLQSFYRTITKEQLCLRGIPSDDVDKILEDVSKLPKGKTRRLVETWVED